MKKLETLKRKELSKVVLGSKFGALIAPEYTIHSTHCEITANTPSYDCGDSSKDK
ncbi:hypothetical protein [Elizabethkingia ursingii]|uniref:hypothetical protein n=1 Tax=Elizabethkingia ursingii TaxID=1756150 RepID=UPI0013F5B5F0|nr:hypothetical protein [Elizabethkingia ursingii]